MNFSVPDQIASYLRFLIATAEKAARNYKEYGPDVSESFKQSRQEKAAKAFARAAKYKQWLEWIELRR